MLTLGSCVCRLVGLGCTVKFGIMEISCIVEVGVMTTHKRRIGF